MADFDKRELADGEEPEAKRSRATEDAADGVAGAEAGAAADGGAAATANSAPDAPDAAATTTATAPEPPTASSSSTKSKGEASAPAATSATTAAVAAPMPALVPLLPPAPTSYGARLPEMVPPPPAAYPAPGMWAQSAYGGWPASAAPYGAYGTGAAYGGGATYGSSGGGGAGGQVCKDFTNGVCNRGVGCKFLHTGGPAAPPPGSKPPCKDFQNGLCTRGANCKFAHEPAAGATGALTMHAPQMPTMFGGPGSMGAAPAAMHGGVALPSHAGGVARYGVAPQASTGGQVCKDFLSGRCARGANCKFVHEGQPMTEVSDQPVCKDFQNGNCSRGAGCRYKHVLETPGSATWPPMHASMHAPPGSHAGMGGPMGSCGMSGGGYPAAAHGGYNPGGMGAGYPQVCERERKRAQTPLRGCESTVSRLSFSPLTRAHRVDLTLACVALRPATATATARAAMANHPDMANPATATADTKRLRPKCCESARTGRRSADSS